MNLIVREYDLIIQYSVFRVRYSVVLQPLAVKVHGQSKFKQR
jgi:hypothetical protein